MEFAKELKNVSIFDFNWRVEHFSQLPFSFHNDCLQSEIFFFKYIKNKESENTGILRLYPFGKSVLATGKVSVIYSNESSGNIGHDKLYIAFLLNSAELQTKINFCEFPKSGGSASEEIVLCSRLELIEHLLPNDTLSITCFVLTESPQEIVNKFGTDYLTFINSSKILLTKHKLDQFSVVWKVLNAKDWNIAEKAEITVPETSEKVFRNNECLTFKISAFSFRKSSFYRLHIEIANRKQVEPRVSVYCRIEVMNGESDMLAEEGTYTFGSSMVPWIFPLFIPVCELKPGKLLTTNGELFLHFEFKCLIVGTEYHTMQYLPLLIESQLADNSHFSELTQNLKHLYDRKELTDVCLQSRDRVIQAHKLVLIAQSPVFKAMFEHPMRESLDQSVAIDDIEPEILHLFLNYLYSGEFGDSELNYDEILQLYTAADKYQVDSLQRRCRIMLTQKISFDNFCNLLSFADLNSDEFLLTAVDDFIKYNGKIVFGISYWTELVNANAKVAAEAMCRFLK